MHQPFHNATSNASRTLKTISFLYAQSKKGKTCELTKNYTLSIPCGEWFSHVVSTTVISEVFHEDERFFKEKAGISRATNAKGAPYLVPCI